MPKRTFKSLSDLCAHAGQEVCVSDWLMVTQEQINQFAQATGDHQWIHVDVERARAGPFGAPIAHGFLTLSMVPRFFDASLEVQGLRMGINYGLNKVRFMAPVPAGSRLRGRLTLASSEPIDNGGAQMVWDVVVEMEGSAKPVCAAQMIVRRYP